MILHKEHGVNPTIPLCWLCQEPKNQLVLLGAAFKKKADMHMIINKEPCDKCKEYMKQGVILISVRAPKNADDEANPYRTGRWVVVSEEYARRIFNDDRAIQKRAAFISDEAWDKIGLPR